MNGSQIETSAWPPRGAARLLAPPPRLRGLGAATLVLGALFLSPVPVRAEKSLADYRLATDLIATTPSTDDGALGALMNPAQWGVPERPELAFWWSDEAIRPRGLDSWGLSVGHRLGFSARRTDFRAGSGPASVTDYQIGMGSGNGAVFTGVAFGWSGGDERLARRTSFVSLGTIHRPSPWLSLGLVSRLALTDDDIQTVGDVGLRPLGDRRLTLFADYVHTREEHWNEGSIAGGIEARPIDGFGVAIRWDDQERVQVALSLTHDRVGLRAHGRREDDAAGAGEGSARYIVRLNPPLRDLDLGSRPGLAKPSAFLELDMKGTLVYQGYRFNDPGSLPLRALTRRIDLAIDSPRVGGVAMNLSGLAANPAMLWEVREKLGEAKRAGKKVLVYADRLDMPLYYFACVADHLILDPQGLIALPGVQMSRTYQKDLLAKIGIGFDELRFFKYKSAMESFSRSSMSDADREQRQELVDDAYAEMAAGIVASGRIGRAALDSLVNEEPVLMPQRALALGLVDRLGRWEDVDAVADTLAGRKMRLSPPKALEALAWRPDEEWGSVPTIAVVYAVGECAMDTGIRGRATSKALRGFRKNRNVRAVVLRADSPGGDALPSDLVAREMETLRKEKKPVITTQGRVAASGGYWISMNSDSILVSPFTITGSIGVIGGWFWNEGLGGKLGLTSDRVQVGRSADLMGGLRLPLLGAVIPERPLDEHERALAKDLILTLYDDFTARVAAGRHLDAAYVREIGEGRVYLGRAGVEKKIVDRVGTLEEAIDAARAAAGIPEGRRVRVVEYPKPSLFRMPDLVRPPSLGLGVGRALAGLGALAGLEAGAGLERAVGAGDGLSDAAPGAPGVPAATYEDLWLGRVLASPGRPLVLPPSGLLPDEEAVTR